MRNILNHKPRINSKNTNHNICQPFTTFKQTNNKWTQKKYQLKSNINNGKINLGYNFTKASHNNLNSTQNIKTLSSTKKYFSQTKTYSKNNLFPSQKNYYNQQNKEISFRNVISNNITEQGNQRIAHKNTYLNSKNPLQNIQYNNQGFLNNIYRSEHNLNNNHKNNDHKVDNQNFLETVFSKCKMTDFFNSKRLISDVSWTMNPESDSVTFILPGDKYLFPFPEFDLKKRKFSAGEIKDIKFKIFGIDEEGEVTNLSIGKKELLSNHLPPQVQLRDLRMVTTRQSQRQISSIITRKDAIILKLEYVKAVIGPNYAYIFDAEEIHVRDFVEFLKKKLENNKHREETAVPQDPFEFCVLEAMLEHVSETFSERLHFFTIVADTFEKMKKNPDFTTLMRLVMFKQSLNFFETEIKEFTSALNEVLENEEDLISMYLSKPDQEIKFTKNDITEMEMLFEGFHKKMQEISNEVARLGKNLEDTRRLHEMSLDSTRNRLMHLNLQLSMFTTALNSGMLIAGIFGMNLLNHYEEHPEMFGHVTLACLGVCVFSYVGFLLWYVTSNNRAAEHIQVGRGWQSEIFQRHPGGFTYNDFRHSVEQALGKGLPEQDARFLFACFDKNRDGSIGLEHFPKKEEKKEIKKEKVE